MITITLTQYLHIATIIVNTPSQNRTHVDQIQVAHRLTLLPSQHQV